MDERLKDIKALLDGDGRPAAEAAPGILETRSGTCAQHGAFVDQQIQIRAYVGLKQVAMPYWLGCPECRQLAEQANQFEAKRWEHLLPGEPAWTVRGR